MYIQFKNSNMESERIPVAFGNSNNEHETRFIVSNLSWYYLYQFAGCDMIISTDEVAQYKLDSNMYSIRQERINTYEQSINATADYSRATGHHGVCHSYLVIRYWED